MRRVDRRVQKAAFIAAVGVAVIAAVLSLFRVKPITAEFLQGEWIQDPEFLQHAGAELDAQKAEIDHWENYEFVFNGQRLTGWRMTFDDGTKGMTGWAEGKGVSFESEFTLTPADKTTALRFTDHKKAPTELRLSRDGKNLAVTCGERKLRLAKSKAANLRARGLIPAT